MCDTWNVHYFMHVTGAGGRRGNAADNLQLYAADLHKFQCKNDLFGSARTSLSLSPPTV